MSDPISTPDATHTVRAVHDFRVAHRGNDHAACPDFAWPRLERFNWARVWFDALAVVQPDLAALTIVEAASLVDRKVPNQATADSFVHYVADIHSSSYSTWVGYVLSGEGAGTPRALVLSPLETG
jgi:hypothetical protein